MKTEISNIEIAESFYKFVIEKLNASSQNPDKESTDLAVKQQAMAAFLYKFIQHQINSLKSQSQISPLKARTVKKQVSLIEERFNQLTNTIQSAQFKRGLTTNNLSKEIMKSMPLFPSKSDKNKNNNVLGLLVNHAITPLFTPWQNQKWFQMIAGTIEKNHFLNQNRALKTALKKAVDFNEFDVMAKSQLKTEYKLNELTDYLNKLKTSEEHYQSIADEVNNLSNTILQEQLPKELTLIINTENVDKLSKLNQIHAKFYKDNNHIITNEQLRSKAFEIANPFILKLEEAILSDLEKDSNNAPYQQIVNINTLSSKSKCASASFQQRLNLKHEQICQQIINQLDAIKKNNTINIYQKIDAINQFLGDEPYTLSPKITQAVKSLQLDLRQTIKQEIEAIYKNDSLTINDKLQQIKAVMKMMSTGSAIQHSYIKIANTYLKDLVNKTIAELQFSAEASHFQVLNTLNALTISALQLNALDDKSIQSLKKQYTQMLWQTSCAIDFLCRQNFIAEAPFVLPADIKKFKLAANAFNASQNGLDNVTKTFISYVLSSESLNETSLKIEQLIIIANHLLHKGSIDGFMAVMTALNNGAITRLNNALNGISAETKQLFKDFNFIIDANNNFPILRKVQHAGIESGINVVPSVILLSKDLTSAAEKPEQSQQVIVNLTNQFNATRTKIEKNLKPFTDKSFQSGNGLDEQAAYQRSLKLEPKNTQIAKPTIMQHLTTLTVPVKPKVFHMKLSKILNSEQPSQQPMSNPPSQKNINPVNSSVKATDIKPATFPNKINLPQSHQHSSANNANAKGKEHSFNTNNSRSAQNVLNTANRILRNSSSAIHSSSSASYIAKLMAFASDEIDVSAHKNNAHDQKTNVLPDHKSAPLISSTKQSSAEKDKTKKQQANSSTFSNFIKIINNAWQGVLRFVSLDINPNAKNSVLQPAYASSNDKENKSPQPSPVKKEKKKLPLSDYNPNTRSRYKSNSVHNGSSSYTLRLFSNGNGSSIHPRAGQVEQLMTESQSSVYKKRSI